MTTTTNPGNDDLTGLLEAAKPLAAAFTKEVATGFAAFGKKVA